MICPIQEFLGLRFCTWSQCKSYKTRLNSPFSECYIHTVQTIFLALYPLCVPLHCSSEIHLYLPALEVTVPIHLHQPSSAPPLPSPPNIRRHVFLSLIDMCHEWISQEVYLNTLNRTHKSRSLADSHVLVVLPLTQDRALPTHHPLRVLLSTLSASTPSSITVSMRTHNTSIPRPKPASLHTLPR